MMLLAALPYAILMANHFGTKPVLLHLLCVLPYDDQHLYTEAEMASMKEALELAARDRCKGKVLTSSIATCKPCAL